MRESKIINRKPFATTFRTLRKKYKLSQKEIAQYIGVSSRQVGYYETEKSKPSLHTAIKIIRFFNINFGLNYDLGYWNNEKRLKEKGNIMEYEHYIRERKVKNKTPKNYSVKNKLLYGYETDEIYERNQLYSLISSYKLQDDLY